MKNQKNTSFANIYLLFSTLIYSRAKRGRERVPRGLDLREHELRERRRNRHGSPRLERQKWCRWGSESPSQEISRKTRQRGVLPERSASDHLLKKHKARRNHGPRLMLAVGAFWYSSFVLP